MDAAVKEKWVSALRSGEFKQGRRSLKTNMPDGSCVLCCLGVLAILQHKMTNHDPYEAVAKLIGCGGGGGNPRWRAPIKALIDMNDTEKKSFTQIADWIEANL